MFLGRGMGATAVRSRGGPCPPAPSRGGARFSPRSAHQNGHFPSSWKMSEMPRAVGRNRAKHLPPNQPSLGPGGAGTGKFCAGWPRPCPPPHAAFRTRCTRTVQRVRSEAHYAAAVPRLARPASGGEPGKAGKSAALPRRAEAEPGPPHVVRIRTDTFLCPEKCPGCRVRWGWAGRSIFLKAALFFARAAPWQKKCLPVFADHGEAVKGYRFGVRRNHVQNNGCGSVFCDFSIPIT